MYPAPPQFFERKVMGNDPVGQNYWIVANGIRLTGMPGYRQSLERRTAMAGQPIRSESWELAPRRDRHPDGSGNPLDGARIADGLGAVKDVCGTPLRQTHLRCWDHIRVDCNPSNAYRTVCSTG